MPEFRSEYGSTGGMRSESDVAESSPPRRVSGDATLPLTAHDSAAASPSRTSVREPGGYLAWTRRVPGGYSTLHACRVHQTVESSIVEADNLLASSRIDSYAPPSDMRSDDGSFPFAPAASVYTSGGGDPKILCLSAGVEMFAIDASGVENKDVDIPLCDRPTRLAAGKFRGQNVAATCLKMMGGDVAFSTVTEAADRSSSSSSSSSSSTRSSSSSPSSRSSSSSSSTVRMSSTSSSSSSSLSSSSSQSSSSSTERFETTSSSSASGTTLSSQSSSSSSPTSTLSESSSSSSQSNVCLWSPVEVVDETFSDMDGHFGGTGAVASELEEWDLSGLNLTNTDACSRLWCTYVPQGTYGVGGSAVGMVYLYRGSSRPPGPPYSNSYLVGGFDLDSSSKYGASWPKTIPITDLGTGSGISGSVKWYGGTGRFALEPGCSAYRLQIPFKLRPEESSSSSPSTQSSPSSRSSASSMSSQSVCPTPRYCHSLTTIPPLSSICQLFPGQGFSGASFSFSRPVTKKMSPNCTLNGTARVIGIGQQFGTIMMSLACYLYLPSGTLAARFVVSPYAYYTYPTGVTWVFTQGNVSIKASVWPGVAMDTTVGSVYVSIPPSLLDRKSVV